MKYHKESCTAKKYYEAVLNGYGKACAVDIGWAGSGAMALKYLIEKQWKLPCEITGLLAGTNSIYNTDPNTAEAMLQSGIMNAYLFSQSHNRDLWRFHDINKGHNLYMELLFGSPEPTLKGFYETESGEVGFRFGDKEPGQDNRKEIQRGIFDFIMDYHNKFERYPYMYRISGRDAYAPFKLATGKKGRYLKYLTKEVELSDRI